MFLSYLSLKRKSSWEELGLNPGKLLLYVTTRTWLLGPVVCVAVLLDIVTIEQGKLRLVIALHHDQTKGRMKLQGSWMRKQTEIDDFLSFQGIILTFYVDLVPFSIEHCCIEILFWDSKCICSLKLSI